MTDQELKGGHPPAERVGGRRIVNKKDRRSSESERTSSESSDEMLKEMERDSGLPAQLERSYPTSAVRRCHDKPLPTHQVHCAQNMPSHVHTVNHVFQPRKHS